MRIREFAEDGMDAMDVNARLERLERENRRMKKIGIVGIVFASVLFISGQAKTNKIAEANEFRLLDGSGNVRADLTMKPVSGPVSGPELSFYDDRGTTVAKISTRPPRRILGQIRKQRRSHHTCGRPYNPRYWTPSVPRRFQQQHPGRRNFYLD